MVIVGFPSFEYDPEGRPLHLLGDYSRLRDVMSDAYYLVCNDRKFGEGSISIHDANGKHEAFRVLAISEDGQKDILGFA